MRLHWSSRPCSANSAWEAPSGRQRSKGPATRVAMADDSSQCVAMHSQNREWMKQSCIRACMCLGCWPCRGRARADWPSGSCRALVRLSSRPRGEKDGRDGDDCPSRELTSTHYDNTLSGPAAQCRPMLSTGTTTERRRAQRGGDGWTDAVFRDAEPRLRRPSRAASTPYRRSRTMRSCRQMASPGCSQQRGSILHTRSTTSTSLTS